jgi:hypothetical protein
MQFGLYLPATHWLPVRRTVSEDSGRLGDQLVPPDPAEAPISVHGERLRQQLLEATGMPVVSSSHRTDDPRELLEVLLFGGEQRLPLEEGNHSLE